MCMFWGSVTSPFTTQVCINHFQYDDDDNDDDDDVKVCTPARWPPVPPWSPDTSWRLWPAGESSSWSLSLETTRATDLTPPPAVLVRTCPPPVCSSASLTPRPALSQAARLSWARCTAVSGPERTRPDVVRTVEFLRSVQAPALVRSPITPPPSATPSPPPSSPAWRPAYRLSQCLHRLCPPVLRTIQPSQWTGWLTFPLSTSFIITTSTLPSLRKYSILKSILYSIM